MNPHLRAAALAVAVVASYCLVTSGPATAASNAPATSDSSFTDNRLGPEHSEGLVSHPDRVRPVTPGGTNHAPRDVPTAAPAPPRAHAKPTPTGLTATGPKALPYDVNGDSYRDVIVGVPGEDLGPDVNAGMFHVLFGTSSGVTAGGQAFHQDSPGVPGSPEDGDQLGWTNTSGDFNADGYADVAVSANAENVGSRVDAGMVLVFYGSATGLRSDNVLSLEVPYTEAFFGDGLAAGDFHGDGYDDLAIGSPWFQSGSVYVFSGGGTGLSTTPVEYSQDYSIPGSPSDGDGLGWTLAAGDINGDGRADLAAGAIYDWEDRGWSTGGAYVLYGDPSGLTNGQRFSKDTPGVPGAPGSFDLSKNDSSDRFGWQVTLADFNGDGKADLAVGAPGSPVYVNGVRKRDAGTVTILYSDGTRISTTGAFQVTQQTPGMPGTAGYEDNFGSTIAGGDANGDGYAELASWGPGDTYVTVVPGGSSGLGYTGAKSWTQNSPGIPGTTEPGDDWGDSLRFEDVKGSGRASLIVGADGENDYRGAITVIHGSDAGLTATGVQVFHQDTPGIAGTAEAGDAFGVFF